jgi:hypothetical protein
MAVSGVGSGGGNALDRFQQLRGAAQKKLEGADRQTDLAELIRRKQEQLGAGKNPAAAARYSAERILPEPSAGPAKSAAAQAAQAPSAAYGRSGVAAKQDAAPRLGQYVDFRA